MYFLKTDYMVTMGSNPIDPICVCHSIVRTQYVIHITYTSPMCHNLPYGTYYWAFAKR